MLRHAEDYARLLRKRIAEFNCEIYLLNTGWVGGPSGQGQRIPLEHTQHIVKCAQSGALAKVAYAEVANLKLEIPLYIPGLEREIHTNPSEYWKNKAAYEAAQKRLITMFLENESGFSVPEEVAICGPTVAE